jgi:hypothetical protein
MAISSFEANQSVQPFAAANQSIAAVHNLRQVDQLWWFHHLRRISQFSLVRLQIDQLWWYIIYGK